MMPSKRPAFPSPCSEDGSYLSSRRSTEARFSALEGRVHEPMHSSTPLQVTVDVKPPAPLSLRLRIATHPLIIRAYT